MRILALDYGKKRTGVAVTDKLQIIATTLDTVDTESLLPFLQTYLSKESVSAFVIGKPLKLSGEEADLQQDIDKLKANLQKYFPLIPIYEIDERFTSKIASQTLVQAGLKKKDRQKKENLDKVSAVLILQSFLDNKPTI